MTTPIPQKTAQPRGKKSGTSDRRPRLKMSIYGYLTAWLAPNIVMAGLVVILNLLPVAEQVGDLTPLLTLVGLAGLVLGLPLTLLVNWLFRFTLNQAVHVLAYALVGMLYGLVVLVGGLEGLLPLLIPVVGFPAGILMALGRWLAIPFTDVVDADGHILAPGEADEDPIIDEQ
ncbi:hypothetical protein [Auritidibacter ignavus]|uniref:hypothetical protein n=1 Tax=Auritidibacter ignavus TaxID=678932 RepID=UPI0018EE884D|nr:hypothetical protein [Auritidibacter ignavus]WGH89879.1 hypothetical protein QDX23_06955 [Auritidibacter ignavus]